MTNEALLKILGKEYYTRDLALINWIKTDMESICKFSDMFE